MVDDLESRTQRLLELYNLKLETLGGDEVRGCGNRGVHEAMGKIEAIEAVLEETHSIVERVSSLKCVYDDELKTLGGDEVRGCGNRGVHEAMGKIEAIEAISDVNDITREVVHAVFFNVNIKTPAALRFLTLGLVSKILDSELPISYYIGHAEDDFFKQSRPFVPKFLLGDIIKKINSEMDGTRTEICRLFLQMKEKGI